MKIKKRIVLEFLVSIIFVFGLLFLLFFYGSEGIVGFIGVENSYIVLFLFAVFGGVSAFTSFSFYAVLGSFYVGGLNFFVLVFLGAVGLSIGDSVFFYLGMKGSDFISHTGFNKKIEYLEKFIYRINPKFMFLFIFIYTGFIPLPKDILCVFFGVSRYSYLKFIIPFFIGNLVFNIIFLFFVSVGFVF